MNSLSDICPIITKLNESGFEIVKSDFDKFFATKEWGWRFVAFDLRMPNGQLVEYYMPVNELEAATKDGNHVLFEKWRSKDIERLTVVENKEFRNDLETSWKKYQKGWNDYLNRQGVTESAAFVSFKSLLASASSRTGLKLSLKSSAENILLRSQEPSTNLAMKSSESEANTLPSSETETIPNLFITENLPSPVNMQKNPEISLGKGRYETGISIRDRETEFKQKGSILKTASNEKVINKINEIQSKATNARPVIIAENEQ